MGIGITEYDKRGKEIVVDDIEIEFGAGIEEKNASKMAEEKTELDVKNYSHTEDDYMKWAVLLMILVGLEVLLRYTVLRHIP